MALRNTIRRAFEPLGVAGPEDEFDPFAPHQEDPEPAEEGDDAIHGSVQGEAQEPVGEEARVEEPV